MEFESKLSNIRIGGRKSDKSRSKIENVTNLSDGRDEIMKDCSTMIFCAGCEAAAHGKKKAQNVNS